MSTNNDDMQAEHRTGIIAHVSLSFVLSVSLRYTTYIYKGIYISANLINV